ncbi:hypothetical protein ACS0TY_024081 [Phlomoides rotata]
MEKMTKKSRFRYMLNNCEDLGYEHLFSGLRCAYLGITVLGFMVLQLVVFCSLEWYSDDGGLSGYEKVVGSLFVVANARYGGESVFDLSLIPPATLVMFVFFMYLPPYTSYLPIQEAENKSINGGDINKRKNKGYLKHILFSQLTYLLIFTILICIIERHKMKHDPLNFNVLNIVFEVVSAYGNVGFSVGYSCEKQIKADDYCKDAWTGFAGRWSDAGKFVLILVMFFGRLKKFSQRGGTPWILP